MCPFCARNLPKFKNQHQIVNFAFLDLGQVTQNC